MSASELNKLAEILLYCLLLTPAYSILIMLGGKKIFKKASKNESAIFYPIINLFTMLEVTETSIFWGILFFAPITNIIIVMVMFYRLGKVFNTSILYKIGLVIFPIIFYPLLANSNRQYKLGDQQFFKLLDNFKNSKTNLMIQSKPNEANKQEEEEEKEEVDSIFKSDVQLKQTAEPYKAVRVDVLGLNKLKAKEEKSKDKDIEIVDL